MRTTVQICAIRWSNWPYREVAAYAVTTIDRLYYAVFKWLCTHGVAFWCTTNILQKIYRQ